jgi:uncharacterized protein YcbX
MYAYRDLSISKWLNACFKGKVSCALVYQKDKLEASSFYDDTSSPLSTTVSSSQKRELHDRVTRDSCNKLSLANEFPFLLVSQPSLELLKYKDEQNVSLQSINIHCFRGNFVISSPSTTPAAYIEDSWKFIRMGEGQVFQVK